MVTWVFLRAALAGDELTDQIEVLAFDPSADRAILRVTAHDGDDPTSACGYAGMKEHPEQGVRLVLWNRGTMVEFEVYAVPRQVEDNAPVCTPRDESVATLARAKARFTEAGLTLGDPLPIIAPDKQGTLELSSGAGRWTLKPGVFWRDDSYWEGLDADIKSLSLSLGSVPVFDHWYESGHWGAPVRREHWELLGGVVQGNHALLIGQRHLIFGGLPTLHIESVDLSSPSPVWPAELPKVMGPIRPTSAIYDLIEVQDLDLARGLVAYRIIGRDAHHPRVCKYDGLSDPTAGVVLGLYVTSIDSVIREYPVYRIARDGDQGCTTAVEASNLLSAAKQLTDSLGLDRTRRPTAHSLSAPLQLAGGQPVRTEGPRLLISGSVAAEATGEGFRAWDQLWVQRDWAIATYLLDAENGTQVVFTKVLSL